MLLWSGNGRGRPRMVSQVASSNCNHVDLYYRVYHPSNQTRRLPHLVSTLEIIPRILLDRLTRQSTRGHLPTTPLYFHLRRTHHLQLQLHLHPKLHPRTNLRPPPHLPLPLIPTHRTSTLPLPPLRLDPVPHRSLLLERSLRSSGSSGEELGGDVDQGGGGVG